MSSTRPLLVLLELTGDAVSFYVLPSADRDTAKEILGQVGRILRAFRARAQELQAADQAAPCPVCRSIGPLKLKVILHYGDAVFTTVGGFTKIAEPDIILAHRLLKNSVIENEYVLVSREFYDMCEEMTWQSAIWQTEYYDGFGDVLVLVQYPGGAVPSRNSLVHRPRSLHRLESPRRLPYIQGRHKSGEHTRPQRAPVRVRRAAAQ